MAKRSMIVILAAGLALAAFGAGFGTAALTLSRPASGGVSAGRTPAAGPAGGCRASVEAAAQRVRTDRRFADADLPGIREYLEISWQVRPLGDPCSRAPGPTDVEYQGVVRLRQADGDSLAAAFDWRVPDAPVPDPAATAWPGLATRIPAGTRWLHSADYADRHLTLGPFHGRLYLDAGHRLVFFHISPV